MKTLLLTSALFAAVLPAFAEDAVPAPAPTSGTLVISGGTIVPGSLVISGESAVATPAAPVRVAAAPSPATGYELRGFFGVGERAEVSIRKPGSVESKWYKVGIKSGEVLVEKIDMKAGTAVILVAGRRIDLRLAGESAPSAGPVVAAHVLSPEEAKRYKETEIWEEKAKACEMRRIELEQMTDTMSPPQRDGLRSAVKSAVDELYRTNLTEAKTTFERRLAGLREDALKSPDSEGNPTTLPDGFESLMRTEFEFQMELRRRTEGFTEREAIEKAAVKSTFGG